MNDAKRRRGSKWLIIPVFCLLPILAHNAFGSGFAIFTHGSAGTGLAGSVVAHSKSPSSIFFNPALISGLEGTQVEVGTTLLFPARKFISDTGNSEFRTKSELFYPSTFYITHKFGQRISLGLGVFNNFGLATRWGETWEGRYQATDSELTVFTFNPVISIRASNKLFLAAGADILTVDTTLERKLNLIPFPDGDQEFKGNGQGTGFNLGVLYSPASAISIGASYRSRIKSHIEADLTHILPTGSEPILGPLFPNTHAESDLTFPDQFQFGVAYKGIRRLIIEGGFRFEGWSSYNEQKLILSQPVAGMTTIIAEKNWNDTYAGNFGVEFEVNDILSLQGGYLYSGNPVPDDTFEPSIPDSDSQVISSGVEFRIRSLTIDISYGYQLLKTRNKHNSLDDNIYDAVINPLTSANGKYDTNLHMAGISIKYGF